MLAVDRARPFENAYFNRGDLIRRAFRVENVLAGGMGVVYICRQLGFDELPESRRVPERHPLDKPPLQSPAPTRPTADPTTRYHPLKSFRRDLFFHEDVRARFDHEALLWVSLRPHPNVVRARSFFQAEPFCGSSMWTWGSQLPSRPTARITGGCEHRVAVFAMG